ncbi:MAG: ABC transporter ATP-binding protein [Oscillospiraceae bacterium]|nr:ABC transporter ATP-binding protein [Oscillospiraceae bacterium]
MENILEVTGLCRSLGDFSLQDVSFSLPRGTIMGLVGENGAGKTTIIRLILGGLAPDRGEIRLLGEDPRRAPAQVKERLGVVTDECCFYESLRPRDVACILRPLYSHWDDGLFGKYLRQFSLPENKTVKEFSKGMKMKLSIAAALSHHPELLILDEATSGLDPIVRDEILDIFLEFIQDETRGVLLSSHIVSDLEKTADYITFLHHGQVKFSEEKDLLLERYGVLRCGVQELEALNPSDRAAARETRFGASLLVPDREKAAQKYPGFVIDRARIEDIMLYMVKGEKQ